MVQLPPQGLHIAVSPVHLGQQLAHGFQGLGFALIPGDFPLVPAGRVEHAVRTFFSGTLQDFAPYNGDFSGGLDDQLAAVADNAVQLDDDVAADGQVITLVQS